MAPQIPDRWLPYKPVGNIIEGTRFIAFKVPLREGVVQSVPYEQRLSCELLLKKIPNLGMIIDLTNTKRYYDPDTFTKKGIAYAKIMVPGQDLPAKEYVDKFNMLVNNFLQENVDNVKLIGVHCTHGLNRTGYLISNYMISQLKINPTKAIRSFEDARGHAIERRNYKDHLLNFERKLSASDEPHPYHNVSSINRTHNSYNNYTPRSITLNKNIDNWRETNKSLKKPVENWRERRIEPCDIRINRQSGTNRSGSLRGPNVERSSYNRNRRLFNPFYVNNEHFPQNRYRQRYSLNRNEQQTDKN